MNIPFKEVKEAIDSAKSITVLSHINPDADALGTALGIYALLTQIKGKRVEVVNVSKDLPIHLDFLPNFQKIKSQIDFDDSLIISCDCGSVDRLGFDLMGRDIINIDHHASNINYGKINVVLPHYASSSQVAYMLFKALYTIDVKSATCFYAALLSDTRYFTTATVNLEVFDVANTLLEFGVEPYEVARNFTQRRPLSSLRILEKALGSLTLYNDARVATLVVSKKDIETTGATVADMEGVVDYAKSLVTVEIAMFLMELEDGIRVSLRSKGADISTVAVAFGGGGHVVAAGFTMKQCELQTSIDSILEKITELGLLHE